jgi:hypothetical protein
MTRETSIPVPGQIYRHSRYYLDDDGAPQAKYLLVLAFAPSGDIVFRLITSRSTGRPKSPPCHHGDPYPGFYLGVLGGHLVLESWLDLRYSDDYDDRDFRSDLNGGLLTLVSEAPLALFHDALGCAAAADDTTRQQERAIRDLLARRA